MKIHAFLLFFMLAAAWGGEARAQAGSPACDPLVLDMHNARSWMGAKRDFESAQTLIQLSKDITFRDSILYVSCFDHHMREMPERDDVLFSDGAFRFVGTGAQFGTLFRFPPLCFGPGCLPIPWLTGALLPSPGNPAIIVPQMPIDIFQPTFLPLPGPNPPGAPMDAIYLDRAVTMLVRWSLRPYWRENFLMHRPPTPLPMPPTVICGSMAGIWREAKCSNINKDNWITFEQAVCTDRTACVACRPKWASAIELANPPPVETPWIRGSGAGADKMYFTWSIHPPTCAQSPPIPTGMIVNVDGTAHLDKYCPGHNCWYDFGSSSCRE